MTSLSDPSELSKQLRVNLSAEPREVGPGASTTLTWTTEGARDVRLWRFEALPFASPEVVDWWRIAELGEPVPEQGERKVSLDSDTNFYLVAVAGSGIAGTRLPLELRKELREQTERVRGLVCRPTDETLARMRKTTRPEEVSPPELAPPRGRLALTVTPKPSGVIYTDEKARIKWGNPSKGTVELFASSSSHDLVPDDSVASGSKHGSIGFGSIGYPHEMPDQGEFTVDGAHFTGHGPAWLHYTVNAQGSIASQWVHVLGVPTFTGNGCTPDREKDIRQYLKEMDARLEKGNFPNDFPNVEAFSMGFLTPQEVYHNLSDQLLNLHITTFECKNETSDKDPTTGQPYTCHWKPYHNEIVVPYTPHFDPTDYAIYHEITHKAGFHDDLQKKFETLIKSSSHQSAEEITKKARELVEKNAAQVAGAIRDVELPS